MPYQLDLLALPDPFFILGRNNVGQRIDLRGPRNNSPLFLLKVLPNGGKQVVNYGEECGLPRAYGKPYNYGIGQAMKVAVDGNVVYEIWAAGHLRIVKWNDQETATTQISKDEWEDIATSPSFMVLVSSDPPPPVTWFWE